MNKAEMSAYLDTAASAESFDHSNIAGILADFSKQLSQADKEFNQIELPTSITQAKQVIFCGMGGSAIGAQVAADLLAKWKRKPVTVINDYDLPAWVNHETLVVVISYSGETAEALSCLDQAASKKAMIVVIASGGKLAAAAAKAKLSLYQFKYKSPPRDALGYLLVPAIILLNKAEVLKDIEKELKPAFDIIADLSVLYGTKTATIKNPAKQLAYRLFDRVPVIVGTNLTRSVARRWKNQINEHGKATAWFDELPEANHNTVEGFGYPARFKDDSLVIFLETSFDHPAVAKRQQLWLDHLKNQGVQTEVVEGKGDDLWSHKLSLIYLGDWASYYLALLNRVDPEAIPTINELKSKLSSR